MCYWNESNTDVISLEVFRGWHSQTHVSKSPWLVCWILTCINNRYFQTFSRAVVVVIKQFVALKKRTCSGGHKFFNHFRKTCTYQLTYVHLFLVIKWWMLLQKVHVGFTWQLCWWENVPVRYSAIILTQALSESCCRKWP